MKTLVLGLGNPILGDDSVGLRVANAVGEEVRDESVTAIESTASGLALLDVVTGYDRVIIIDAIQTKGGQPGSVYRLTIDQVDVTKHTASAHDTTLTAALELGKQLGLKIPEDIVIVAIEIPENCSTFSEECTPPIETAIPVAVAMVLKELKQDPR